MREEGGSVPCSVDASQLYRHAMPWLLMRTTLHLQRAWRLSAAALRFLPLGVNSLHLAVDYVQS